MTPEDLIRLKALDEPRPLTWASEQLARALRILEAAQPHIPDVTVQDKGLRMAIEFMLIDLTKVDKPSLANRIAKMHD